MTYFLAVQSTYSSLEIAVFSQEKLLSFIREDKIRASKNLIPLIAYTLDQAQVPLEKIAFIAVNQGPGPFTNLRVAIATVNGLSFAHSIPLIGLDALDVFMREYAHTTAPIVVLFNAFNTDVYYAIKHDNGTVEKGYKNIDLLLTHIQNTVPQQILFLGNGTELYHEKITLQLKDRASIPSPLALHGSIQTLGICALEQWHKKEGLSNQLMPLYLKQAL